MLRKHDILSAQQRQAQIERQRLISNAERYAYSCSSLEKENTILKSRVRELEAVSDKQLQELLLEWIASHQGQLNIPQFCAAYGLPAARCEEGIAILLKQGAIREIPGKFTIQFQGAQARHFSPTTSRLQCLLHSVSKFLPFGPGKASP